MAAPGRTQVFICYSHEDAEWLKRLQIMLRPLTRNHSLDIWDDTRIQAGSQWREEIRKALNAAKVAVLLVSPNFLASDFVTNDELPTLLKAAEKGGLVILWVAVSHSLYEVTDIAAYQAANNPTTPLDSLGPSALNAELVKIALKIREAAPRPNSLRSESSPASAAQQRPVISPGSIQPFEPEIMLIPAGEFLMGSDRQHDEAAFIDEEPQHRLYLPDYYLAKTPVTKAQYSAFVLASGREAPKGWTNRTPPHDEEAHPVVNVSWYDARDYCQWLSKVTGRGYDLPSEAEWEKGARGTNSRIYPWGDRWHAMRCNSEETGQGQTTSVYAYPQGASPYGLLDTAGNVFEWTRSRWGTDWGQPTFRYPYTSDNGREDGDASPEMFRVLRGGAFDSSPRFVRCAFRLRNLPNDRVRSIGFRVVVLP